jgi:hypothetical protein
VDLPRWRWRFRRGSAGIGRVRHNRRKCFRESRSLRGYRRVGNSGDEGICRCRRNKNRNGRRGRGSWRGGRRRGDGGSFSHCGGMSRRRRGQRCARGHSGSRREGGKAGESRENRRGWQGSKRWKWCDGRGWFLLAALIGKPDQDQTEAVAGQGSDDDQDQGVTQPKAGIRVRKHGGMITPCGESDKRLKKRYPEAPLLW